MRLFVKIASSVFVAFFALWLFAPLDRVNRQIDFQDNSLPADLDAWLAAREADPDIRPSARMRIVWAGSPGARTPLAVIYVHGFSASAEEIRPVPDRVAEALGANLFFTRLTGHGRSGDAMATATADDWIEDMAEAMAIGRRIGDRVLVISTSTGGTLTAIAATDPVLSGAMAGVVLISPNFRLNSGVAGAILDAPFARWWGPLVAGERRTFAAKNDRHAAYWTTDYPTLALFPMATLMREARAQDYATAKTPLLLIYSEQDQVINPAAIAPVRDAWGGPVQQDIRVMGPGDDPGSHVIAGDTLSPGQTAPVADLITAWARAL